MAEQSVTLLPGQVSPVSTGIAPGTTIYNGDANNAVWVSENGSPGPGVGMRIGPKGSLSWTSGGAVYGVTDTGVTSPVTLTLSPNVGSLVNPVDVGAAVSAQLLAQGVPSVFLGSELARGAAMPATGTNRWGITGLDVSKYASITITFVPTAIVKASATFVNADASYSLGSFEFPYSLLGGGVTFTLPVTGPFLSLILAGTASTSSYIIYGSNRPVTAPILYGNPGITVVTSGSNAFTSGGFYYFPQQLRSNGKPMFCRLTVTGGGKGILGVLSMDGNGNTVLSSLIDSSLGAAGLEGSETRLMVNMPPGVLGLYFYSFFTGTYYATAQFVPQV